MGTQETKEIVERYFDLLHNKKFDAVRDVVSADFVEEYPQSGERIRGLDNALAIAEAYPGLPTLVSTRVTAVDDLAIMEAELDYSGTRFHTCTMLWIEDGKIARSRAYFGEPYPAPEWRAKWVEKMS